MSAENGKDLQIIRELAQQYAELAAKPIQDERRDLWRRHNSLVRTRPLIYVRWLAAWQEHSDAKPQCEDPFWRRHETFLRQMIFQDTIGDDYILEPWITQRASVKMPPNGPWGVRYATIPPNRPGGAWKNDPPLRALDDFDKLVQPHHEIDEEATRWNVERLQDAVGDLLEVDIDRSPAYVVWHADLSTDLGYLRGIDRFMIDMIDNPQWLQQLLAFMRDGVLRTHEEAEAAGDWSLANHQNQAQPYSQELADPQPNTHGVKRSQLWCFTGAQEYALVGPQQHWDFLLQYQVEIMKHFGLSAYGCCEDLTQKIGILRRIPNLRRIAVTPRADVAKSAEQIGQDYVLSWRPNPVDMICCGFDPDHIRKVIRNGMEASKGCHVDLTLKDVQTVGGKPELLREWVKIVREITDGY